MIKSRRIRCTAPLSKHGRLEILDIYCYGKTPVGKRPIEKGCRREDSTKVDLK
jgi:hypothetical protein